MHNISKNQINLSIKLLNISIQPKLIWKMTIYYKPSYYAQHIQKLT